MVKMLDFHIYVRKQPITSGTFPRSIETLPPFSEERLDSEVIFKDRCDSTLFANEMIVEYLHAIVAVTDHTPRLDIRVARNGVCTESRRNFFIQDVEIVVFGDLARFEDRVNYKRHALPILARFLIHNAFVRLLFGI
jgi:hypothetical protein